MQSALSSAIGAALGGFSRHLLPPLSSGITPPGAPTIGTATGGNAQATVTWTPPASPGGAAITGYRITASTGQTATFGLVTSGTITGLTNGVAATFVVAATNGSYGPASAASNSITPVAIAPPGAPTIGTATGGNAQATVAFTPGSPVGDTYTVTSTPGGFTATGAGSPLTVTGLTNGVAYTFKSKGNNGGGTGPESAASNSVTPLNLGAELVRDGAFSTAQAVNTNTANWATYSNSTISGGVANVNNVYNGPGANGWGYQLNSVAAGTVYRVEFTVVSITTIGDGVIVTLDGGRGTARTAVGTYVENITASNRDGGGRITIEGGNVNAGFTGTIDNVSVKQVL